MDPKMLWCELCFRLFDNIKTDISEKEFEGEVIHAIEKLGWSEFAGEIKRQPELQIGRGRVRPDVVIYGHSGKALVVIEVKRPSETIFKDEASDQLISYMLQLKAEFGLLIGSDIRLYYDGDDNPQQKPLHLRRITFSKDDEIGPIFVSIFQKTEFQNEKYKPYIVRLINEFTAERNIKKLKESLMKAETKTQIYEFLRTNYTEYGSDVVESALKDLKIDLSFGSTEINIPAQIHYPVPSNENHNKAIYVVVFDAISQASPNGISKANLGQVTGLTKKQIDNMVYKLNRMGMIAAKEKGIYIAIKNSIPQQKNRQYSKTKKHLKPSIESGLPTGFIRQKIYNEIKNFRKGCTKQDIESLGYRRKQIDNVFYYLKKKGFIEAKERNLYIVK